MPFQKTNFNISAHPDLATQLLQILIPTRFYSFFDKKGNLHFSHVLEDGLLRKDFVINPKKSKLKILHGNVCLSKKLVFWKLPVQKTGWKGPG